MLAIAIATAIASARFNLGVSKNLHTITRVPARLPARLGWALTRTSGDGLGLGSGVPDRQLGANRGYSTFSAPGEATISHSSPTSTSVSISGSTQTGTESRALSRLQDLTVSNKYKSQPGHIGTMASVGNSGEQVPATTQQSSEGDVAATPTPAATEPELPKLSMEEFRVYNRLAVMMDAYHNHFRYTWNLLYKTCTSGSRPAGLSIRSFISQGMHLCHALTVHHTIEEQHIFPELAERMPAFAPQDHLISQHEQIHEGLEKMEEYLDACRTGERELRLPELKEIMDSFADVLWTHLDDEVRMLGAENIRKYWSKEEVLSMHW